ncbi:hypothetical protein ACIQMV_09010 [Streptomyces sp. NPDC091412]|uniref:hypothetical protein n=1 Tax=Streptomyces sp. NPDC091412 TaxID=3366002 RepID=UPI00381674F6
MTNPTDPAPGRQTTDTIPQLCCHCGRVTRQPVLVDDVHTPAGEGNEVYACPDDAVLFGEQYAGPTA